MIRINPMSEDQFNSFLKTSVDNYAQEKIKAENLSIEDGYKIANTTFDSLLPQGLLTKSQYLYFVFNYDQEIGWFWFGKKVEGKKEFGYIYDIYLLPEHRGKGYGKNLMSVIESEIKSLGFKTIRLQVFGHNTIAQKLYLNSGFHITNIMMNKEIT
jgi:ribosomal protein S18 acetylase RimI-like enzyme